MAAVVFDYAGWSTRYPELATYVAQPLAAAYFSEATLYVDNTACSPITDDSVGGQRYMILNMVTAHIAALNAPLNFQPSSPLVGRISNATQGSVSVQTEYATQVPGSMAWFTQTKYGAAAWQAMAQFRTFRYVHGHERNMDPYSPFGRH
jgi:hypothetical protein